MTEPPTPEAPGTEAPTPGAQGPPPSPPPGEPPRRAPGEEAPLPAIPNPWWIPPFLGRVPAGVEERQLKLLGYVAIAMFFENFDLSLLSAVLKFLAIDFELSKADLGTFTGNIRLGALPAFFLIPLSDLLGRRRVFIASIVGVSIATFCTAFTQNAAQFVFFQAAVRTFSLTATAISFVIVTEEFPAAHRGWGIGMLGAVAGAGFGAGALLFALYDYLPFGWRSLYVLGIAPIFLVAWLGRVIPETARYQASAAGREWRRSDSWGKTVAGVVAPIVELARRHPRRTSGVVGLGVLATGGMAVAFQLTGEFVQTERGWQPWQYSAMYVVCGAVGMIGSPWAGRMGDRFGRRTLSTIALVAFPIWVAAFYLGPNAFIPVAWIGMVYFNQVSTVLIRALTNESFPTERRGTAGGLLSLLEVLGAFLGLRLYAWAMGVVMDQPLVVTLVSLLAVFSCVCIPLYPETRQRELEDIEMEGEVRR